MAAGAGSAGFLPVLLVARETTESLVHADSGAVVSGAHLHGGVRRVALVAERLAAIGAHPHRAPTLPHGRERQALDRNVLPAAAVK